MQRDVVVRPATAAEEPLIAGLFQFYAYDFSEMEPPGSTDMAFNAAGAFDPYPYLDDYWRAPDRWPLLILVGDELAGFALVNTHSHLTGGEVERNMAEFFVARKHRHGGVAQQAVRQVLARHPGRWEVAVVERNVAAKSFWPKAITSAPGIADLTRLEGDGEHWRGPIWTFVAASVD